MRLVDWLAHLIRVPNRSIIVCERALPLSVEISSLCCSCRLERGAMGELRMLLLVARLVPMKRVARERRRQRKRRFRIEKGFVGWPSAEARAISPRLISLLHLSGCFNAQVNCSLNKAPSSGAQLAQSNSVRRQPTADTRAGFQMCRVTREVALFRRASS